MNINISAIANWAKRDAPELMIVLKVATTASLGAFGGAMVGFFIGGPIGAFIGGGIGGASGASYAYSQKPLYQVLEEFLKDQKKKRLLSEYLKHNIPDLENLTEDEVIEYCENNQAKITSCVENFATTLT